MLRLTLLLTLMKQRPPVDVDTRMSSTGAVVSSSIFVGEALAGRPKKSIAASARMWTLRNAATLFWNAIPGLGRASACHICGSPVEFARRPGEMAVVSSLKRWTAGSNTC